MDANVFKYCTGLKLLGSFMVLVVLAIVGITYYAIVVATYGPDLFVGGGSTLVALCVLLLFHGLLAMLLWSYFATVLTDPGGVPDNWSPYGARQGHDADAACEKVPGSFVTGAKGGSHKAGWDEAAKEALLETPGNSDSTAAVNSAAEVWSSQQSNWPVTVALTSPSPLRGALAGAHGGGVEGSGECSAAELVEVRKCKKCLHFKPPRTHHCSICRRCILKMDHHCVWVVNCVGAKNYKAFLLFMLYTCLDSLLVSIALLPRFVTFFAKNVDGDVEEPGQLAVVFLSFVLNVAFSLSLMGFLAIHGSMVASNTTTIEAFEKSKAGSRQRFDMGRQRNFEQVLGRDRRYWFLPLYSPEDLRSMPELSGLEFPCKVLTERQLLDSRSPALALDID